MSNLLYTQYALVRETRMVVFQFLEMQVTTDISIPVPSFAGKTISYMLVHIANTYIAWTANFAMKGSHSYCDQDEALSLAQLKNLFIQVDELMSGFIAHFSVHPTQAVKGFKWPGKYIETDAYSIFTHVITHEFHHKGQVMTMARLLGHTPVDTDVMRF
nr:DinB family protein [Pedobacter panaciterrae]